MAFAASQAQDLFKRIRAGLPFLHGRLVWNVFDRHLGELELDLADLMQTGYLTESLEAADLGDALHLPDFEKTTPHTLRYMWDYFAFLYMSHKIQNLKRRRQPLPVPTLIYLRGCDYGFAVKKETAAAGYATAVDQQFQSVVVTPLRKSFNVVKALSPTDLSWIMMAIDNYLAAHGNTLSGVCEFARARDEGIFLNSMSWKNVVVQLFPSASVFLVYVSNQSQGLRFELESLLGRGLERNSVLVLDKGRFDRRHSFFAVQDSLRDELYSSVVEDDCAVDDTDAFERLLDRFPFRLEMSAAGFNPDPAEVIAANLRETGFVPSPADPAKAAAREPEREAFLAGLASLIGGASRAPEQAPCEIPFEFKIHLDAETQAALDALRRHLADRIDGCIAAGRCSNWPAALLFIELDVFLSLISGEVCRAARAMARYGTIADFVCDFVRSSPGEDTARAGAALEQHANMAMGVAIDALSLGEWNDYGDRRPLARESAGDIEVEVRSALSRSAASASAVKMKPRRPQSAEDQAAVQAGVDLQRQLLDAAIGRPDGPRLTLIDLHEFHRDA